MTPRGAMIFAAGLGTRMGTLTRDRPKPLLTVGGRTLLDHALAVAREAGVSAVVVNAHAHAEQIAAHLARSAPEALVSREPERLETGGGLKAALPLLPPGPVFTINADMVWRGPNPLRALSAAWRPAAMGALLALVPREAAVGHGGAGDFELDPSGRLTRRGDAPEAAFVYAGAQIIDPAALGAFRQTVFSLNLVWDALLREGRLHGVVWRGGWVDVGRPEGLALAEEAMAR